MVKVNPDGSIVGGRGAEAFSFRRKNTRSSEF
jgi:hypothetical protein